MACDLFEFAKSKGTKTQMMMYMFKQFNKPIPNQELPQYDPVKTEQLVLKDPQIDEPFGMYIIDKRPDQYARLATTDKALEILKNEPPVPPKNKGGRPKKVK